MKDEIKSPSTAEFTYSSDVDIEKSGKTYTINGYVDTENSFGANIRQNFEAKVRYDGGLGTLFIWSLSNTFKLPNII